MAIKAVQIWVGTALALAPTKVFSRRVDKTLSQATATDGARWHMEVSSAPAGGGVLRVRRLDERFKLDARNQLEYLTEHAA